MKKINVTFTQEGVITKIRPVKFRELEGKTIIEAISFVNDEQNTERRKRFMEIAEFFDERVKWIKNDCKIYGIKWVE